MSQFLLMTSDVMAVIEEAGGRLNYDFIRKVVQRRLAGPKRSKVASWP